MNNDQLPNGDLLDLLATHDGYYLRTGTGPLVGYAGRDKNDRQYVGMEYVNFAAGERHGRFLQTITDRLYGAYPALRDPNCCFCGAPEGGKALAVALALHLNGNYIFPETEITALKTPASREKKKLVWKRHQPRAGEKVWIVEDVCNNFSTTEDLITLIESTGANVRGIICFLNRSFTIGQLFRTKVGSQYIVFAAVKKPMVEYTQCDLAVAADVAAGNVVWKPKDEWARLRSFMEKS